MSDVVTIESLKADAERLIRLLRENPEVASVKVVYWDEVVEMSEVRENEISK
jgi:hypothetical protein